MGFETDAFEQLDKELEEELKQRNFHLAKHVDSLMFERKLIPVPSWLLVSLIFSFLGFLLLLYLLNYFFRQLFVIAINYFLTVSLDHYGRYIHLGILLFSLFISMKVFLGRIISKLYSFFYLSFTEYIITNNYIYLRSRAGLQKGRLIPLSSISSIITRQNILERIFGVGDIVIQLKTGQNFYIHSVNDYEEVAKNLILMIKEEEEG